MISPWEVSTDGFKVTEISLTGGEYTGIYFVVLFHPIYTDMYNIK